MNGLSSVAFRQKQVLDSFKGQGDSCISLLQVADKTNNPVFC